MRTDAEYKVQNPDGTMGKITFFDIPLDLDSIARHGSMVRFRRGSIVIDDSRIHALAMNNINRFYAHESCGSALPAGKAVRG